MRTQILLLGAAAALLLAGATAVLGQYGAPQGGNDGGGGGGAPSYPSQGGGPGGADQGGGNNQGGDGQDAPGQSPNQDGPRRGGPDQGGGEGDGQAGAPSDASPPLTLSDAADNFQVLVETYLARNSVNGAWSYKEKGSTARLKLVSVKTASVKEAGANRYAGIVTLRDVRTKRKRDFIFTADFSGTTWKVVSARPAGRARAR